MLLAQLGLAIFLLINFISVYGNTLDSCHPKPSSELPQYIVGYGSLMETQSKNGTDNTSGKNNPVEVDHYQRGWFSQGLSTGLSTTYLAVTKNEKAHFNGAIFRLANSESIKNYDKREKYYCRVAVPPSLIHPLGCHTLPQGEYWIYEIKPEFKASPSVKYPIVESYVDIFLSGCLELQEKFHLKNFAAECIDTTTSWSEHWVNDRIFPRRPFVFQPNAIKIDTLLTDKIPKFFNKIKQENT